MTEPLIVLFVGIGIAVLIGVLVVAVMVRTRRPGGGIREWIRQSADSWQENDYQARAKHSGERVRLDTLLAEASPEDSAIPLAEVENLRTAAGQMWGEEVDAIRTRRAEKEASRAKNVAALSVEEGQALTGQLPPTFAPTKRRRPPKNVATSRKNAENAFDHLSPSSPGKALSTSDLVCSVPDSAEENRNLDSGKSPQKDSPADKPIRRWARKFQPDVREEEFLAEENSSAQDGNFQVDKVSWRRVRND